MSAHKSAMPKTLCTAAEFSRSLECPPIVVAKHREGQHGMAVHLDATPRVTGVFDFLRDCWRRMRLMKRSFDHAELGDPTRARERSDEHRRNEEDWLRTEDEGCPNARQELDRRGQNIIRIGGEAS